jgi:hypothetical protein
MPESFAWMLDWAEKFKDVFAPRVRDIPLPQPSPAAELEADAPASDAAPAPAPSPPSGADHSYS